jgi:hypothetical protein
LPYPGSSPRQNFLIQLSDHFGQGNLNLFKSIITFLLQAARILLGLKLPIQLIMFLLDLASVQLPQLCLGRIQLSFTAFNSLLQLGVTAQLQLDQFLL